MIALFSDFGVADPYVGLMKLAIYKHAPNCQIIDICHDLPVFNPNASGCLLQALVRDLPKDAIVLAIVDPGVGTERHALWLEIDGRHFIGPDNGLFARLVNAGSEIKAHVIQYNQSQVSASFHGRDVFAPATAKIAIGTRPESEKFDIEKLLGRNWPIELAEIIYIDHYGNAMTGLSAGKLSHESTIAIKNRKLSYARTFAEAKVQEMFWYMNSLSLIELSMFARSIQEELNLQIGELVFVQKD